MLRSPALFASICRAFVLVAAGLAMTLPGSTQAQGDLLVAPTRLVLNGGGSAEVVLSNIGSRPATYRINLELRRMGTDGRLEDVDEAEMTPEQKALLDMFRYAPRRIVLPPNQPQSVRISARPPEGLPDGEYRVHMSFRAIPDTQAVDSAAVAPEDGGFSIRLTPIYGVSIPVIMRKGQLTGGATITNPRILREGDQTFLSLDLNRTGNRSVFGEIRVMAPGAKQPAYLVRGIAVYPEVQGRNLRLQLNPAQTAALKGPMQVEYREMPENGGKLITAASATF